MAIRRVYYIDNNKVRFFDFDIHWNGGFSIQQKQKNITELHDKISEFFNVNKSSILEVSTKSKSNIGVKLSSFNLKISKDNKEYSLESVYQSSKVFSSILGNYQVKEALEMNPKKAKVRLSIENHSALVEFDCFGKRFPLSPSYLFYDWLYINAVSKMTNINKDLDKFKYFTDIEFNPRKSLSCQARSIVLYIWLIKNNKLDLYLNDPTYFYKNLEQ